MNQLPIYLKTDDNMPRPTDPVYHLVTSSGSYRCRNHDFFISDVPVDKPPGWLAPHAPRCKVKFPKLGQAALEYIVGFFDCIYELHGSEAIVLLFWNLQRRRYKLCIPKQQATVWESYSGYRTALDVKYELPTPMPAGQILLADIHSHCEMDAGASHTDQKDEEYRDGAHAIVGRLDLEPPDFNVAVALDGFRFAMQFEHLFKSYHSRRRRVPQKWIDQVSVTINRPQPARWNQPYYDDNWAN